MGERSEDDAKPLLLELLEETRRLGLARLHGNCLELSAQNEALGGRWDKAEQLARRAEEELLPTGVNDLLYARKWLAVCKLAQKGDLAPLASVRNEAAKMGHWETLRECDLFQGTLLEDQELLAKVYFASPYAGYRRRLFSQLQFPMKLSEEYQWNFGNSGKPRAILEVATGIRRDKRAAPKLPPTLQSLLVAVSEDLYRPSRLASLHATLYPDENFYPHSSPARMHQILRRFRQWLRSERIPLSIDEEDGAYFVRARAPIWLVLRRATTAVNDAQGLESRLQSRFPEAFFNVRDVVAGLGVSRRSAQRLLQEASEKGRVEVQGAGPATRYRIRSSSK